MPEPLQNEQQRQQIIIAKEYFYLTYKMRRDNLLLFVIGFILWNKKWKR